MGRFFGVIGFGRVGGDVRQLHVVTVDFFADQRQFGLGEGNAVFDRPRRQMGQRHLVAVAPRFGAEDHQVAAVFLGIEADGEILVCLHEAVRVAHGLDEDRDDAFVPQRAQLPPADGHGVVITDRSGRQQRPVLVEKFENVRVQFVDVFHDHDLP